MTNNGTNGHSNGHTNGHAKNGKTSRPKGTATRQPLGSNRKPLKEGAYTWSKDEFIEALRAQGRRWEAAQTLGITVRSVQRRAKQDPEFHAQLKEISREQNAQLEDSMLHRAMHGVVEDDIRCVAEITTKDPQTGAVMTKRKFEKVGEKRRFHEASAIFLSKARMPHLYSERAIEIRAMMGEDDDLALEAKFNLRQLSPEGREHLRALLEEQRAIERGVSSE